MKQQLLICLVKVWSTGFVDIIVAQLAHSRQATIHPSHHHTTTPRLPAMQLLLAFHNATFATSYKPDSSQEDLNRVRSTAAGLLLKKLIVSCLSCA